MSAPRNRVRFDAARADCEAIRALLEARRQSEPLLTPKELLRLLGWSDERLRTVRRHVEAIRGASLSQACEAAAQSPGSCASSESAPIAAPAPSACATNK